MADIDARPEETSARERLGRIVFRAWRRGFREADLVLGPFADQVGATLTDDELDSLEALLAEDDDHRLYAWIIGSEPTPPVHDTAVMGKIREFMCDHVAAAVAEGAG